MPYVDFDSMDMEDQIKLLHTAVKELQERFAGHRHMPAGNVTVDMRDMSSADLDGKFEEGDDD